jgi:hypothetical protein
MISCVIQKASRRHHVAYLRLPVRFSYIMDARGIQKISCWSNRAQKYGKHFKWFFEISWLCDVFVEGCLCVLIIPKLLIWVTGWIAILFGTFLELPKHWPNVDPRVPYLLQKYSKSIRNLWNHFHQNMIVCKMGVYNSEFGWTAARRYFWK